MTVGLDFGFLDGSEPSDEGALFAATWRPGNSDLLSVLAVDDSDSFKETSKLKSAGIASTGFY